LRKPDTGVVVDLKTSLIIAFNQRDCLRHFSLSVLRARRFTITFSDMLKKQAVDQQKS
jgi:hypothetical protein